jgi:hypothetical protein
VVDPVIWICIHFLVGDRHMMVENGDIYLVVVMGIGEPFAVIYSHCESLRVSATFLSKIEESQARFGSFKPEELFLSQNLSNNLERKFDSLFGRPVSPWLISGPTISSPYPPQSY